MERIPGALDSSISSVSNFPFAARSDAAAEPHYIWIVRPGRDLEMHTALQLDRVDLGRSEIPKLFRKKSAPFANPDGIFPFLA